MRAANRIFDDEETFGRLLPRVRTKTREAGSMSMTQPSGSESSPRSSVGSGDLTVT